ncbi:MAG: phosphotransferase [Alphaproteobacteria bacterium]|nr:phosphotransferase [Alphaproteobacteria bacterium]
MISRADALMAFLKRHSWEKAERHPMAADFSSRHYSRMVNDQGQTAVLMDAEGDQKTGLFVSLAKVLRDLGLCAPEIYGSDPENGFVLMQDFGQRNVGVLLDQGAEAGPFFLSAADILAKLHRTFDPTAVEGLALPRFDSALLTDQAGLFLDAYFPIANSRAASEEERQSFLQAWHDVLGPLDALPQSLLLRDFMPDNLMELPGGMLGLLDFQDAGLGPVAYDLASLCEEVRHDGGFALLDDVLERYGPTSEVPLDTLRTACLLCSAQRHTRILGIIARRSTVQGLCDKFAFLPRIRHHLSGLLDNEVALAPVKNWFDTFDRLLQ